MLQIINMFLIVLIFWLIIEYFADRANKNRKLVKVIDPLNNKNE